jgi:hypothetical protein
VNKISFCVGNLPTTWWAENKIRCFSDQGSSADGVVAELTWWASQAELPVTAGGLIPVTTRGADDAYREATPSFMIRKAPRNFKISN